SSRSKRQALPGRSKAISFSLSRFPDLKRLVLPSRVEQKDRPYSHSLVIRELGQHAVHGIVRGEPPEMCRYQAGITGTSACCRRRTRTGIPKARPATIVV